jgi:PIN domain nuclease of toxin-antitoxin system
VKLLLDTQLLLWAAASPARLPPKARRLIENPEHELLFSVASLWEVAIKAGLGRKDFTLDAGLLRRGLIDNGYGELPILGEHAAAVARLPDIHKDPIDRMLAAQSASEGLTLLTTDETLAGYPGSIRKV